MSFNEWKTYKVGDFAEVQNGYAFKSDDFTEKGIPVIKIKNIVSPKINLDSVQFFNGELTDRLEQFLIKKGDILISMTGSHLNQIASAVGKVGKYQFDFPAFINQRVGKVYIKDKTIGNEGFLYYFLNRFETQLELVTNAGGSANQANISPSQIKNLEIRLPEVNTQKKIASILSSLDDKIELNEQTNHTLEEIAESLFKEMCLPKDKILPNGWRNIKLNEVADFVKGVSYRSSELVPSKFALVTLKSINRGGGLNFNGFKEFDGKHKETQVLQEGDIVIAQTDITQNADVVGCPAIVENPFDYEKLIASIDLVKCKPKDNVFSNEVLFYFLKYQTFKDFCLSHTNGSTVLHLRSSELLNYEFIIPNKKTLADFGKLVKSIRGKIIANNKETQTLIALRDSLLPKLMKGEIPIS